jgi:branched-subunit amino acid transport protein
MSFIDYLLLVAGMGLVTYIPRWFPLFALSQRHLPEWLIEWLSLIPIAILAALLAPILFANGETRTISLGPELLVAIPTLFFAWKTRSLGGTVLVGMLLYWLVS